jgi:nonsense-mediated mRNA decay protein 3
MFCVECGKETPIYKNGVCVPCYIKKTRFTKGPHYIDIFQCATCPAYKYKNTWIQEPFDQILLRFIKDSFTINSELTNITITPACKPYDKTIACNLTISGLINNTLVSEQHQLKIRLKKLTCEICSRQSGGYYEATLQIRAEDRKLSKEQLEEMTKAVDNIIQNIIGRGNRALFITDTFEQHGGIDFYLSEKGSALTIAKKLIEQYGGDLKQSSKNVGMKDRRQIYRMTYLVRLPKYRKHDIILLGKTDYLISSLSSNKIHLIDLVAWKEKTVEHKDLASMSMYGGKELVKEMILVSQTRYEVQLMDTKNYTIVELRKPHPITYTEKTVSIIKLDNRLYLYPHQEK